MKRSRGALLLFAAAFVGWMCYLGYTAWQYRKPPVIVSRAQLLAAEFDVVAQVDADPTDGQKPASPVTVLQLLYSADEKGAPKDTEKIAVQNLSKCVGFTRSGEYVLPLAWRNGLYYVAFPPLDPGVPSYRTFDPRIYPLTDEVRRQFAEIRAAKP
ncbi:MAG: hypothetical protein ACJ8F7_18895 [Gemmataceae bacterium]